ncbi:MAG TPA: tetratricopeptide repeat protein [Bryobacteraceae bacterium]
MKRQTRKDLKTDPLAQELGETVEFISAHKSETVRYGAIALAAIVIIGGTYIYMRHQATVRQEALADAMKLNNAVVSPTPQPPNINFATQAELDKAWTKAFTDVATNYHGHEEGAIAQIYLAAKQSDKGNLPEAEKMYKDVMDSAPKEYSAWARISLAQVYASEGKIQDARALLDYLVAHPTDTISKEQATIELAEILTKSNPAEARKLLQPLATSRTAVSRTAIDLIGRLPQAN